MNWCFWTVVLEKTLGSPLNCKEIKPVNFKVSQSWIFIGRTDAEAEAPILWPPNAMSQLIGKEPDIWKDWGQEEEGDNRGWDGWIASLTQWTWVWASFGRWWRTRKPGMLQSQFSSVQSLSRVGLFATPWTVACQASLSFTVFWSLLKFMSFESVMPSNGLLLCHPLL